MTVGTLEANAIALAGRLLDLSASLRPGEVTAICGPNGAGKSSLLSCLAGLLTPDSGEVRLEGAPLASLPPRERARAIGYLPQSAEVAWDLSVETLAGLGRIPWGDTASGPVEEALAALQLDDLRRRPLSRLSGGERARALLARVLAGQPRWLLADEPLANLDLAHGAALVAHFRALAATGMGVVLVLHDLAQAMNHGDRVLVLSGGRLIADGPPDEALHQDIISGVWGIQARWLGEPGRRALALG